jgi:hypothetical protein
MNNPKIKILKPFNWKKLSSFKKTLSICLAAGIFFILSLLTFLLIPQIYLNGLIKDRILIGFTKAYPGYSLKIGDVNFNFLKNNVECDSVSLTNIDSSFSSRIDEFSLSGIGWIKLFRESDNSLHSISEAVSDIKGITLHFKQLQYQVFCKQLHLSVPDSIIAADSLVFKPLVSDEPYFAESKFRGTRYRLAIPKINVNGLAYSGLLYGNTYHARSINISDAFIDVLVNMDKPFDTKSPSPLMPNEGLSSITDTIRVDSIQVINSRLKYSERNKVRAKPAEVTFDKIQALTQNIINHSGKQDTLIIHAQGVFMNASKMKLFMSIPLSSPQFSLSYSGSLAKMDLDDLNKFLVISDHHRIKSGVLYSANYNVNVNSGHATGYVHAEYNDLSVALLNKNTNSENGILDEISSFLTKVFIIKANNMPDKSGSMRIGIVKYTRKSDETFTQFVWFSLRSGVCNLIGI